MTDEQRSIRPLAGRIQWLIEEQAGTVTAFGKWLTTTKRDPALARAVRGWIPPTSKWRWDGSSWSVRVPRHGKRQQKADWDDVRLPDSRSLRRFCNALHARADFILFGEGPPYRNEDRSPQSLEKDLAAAVARKLATLGYSLAVEGLRLDGHELFGIAFDTAREQLESAREENRFSDIFSDAINHPTAPAEEALPWETPGDVDRIKLLKMYRAANERIPPSARNVFMLAGRKRVIGSR